MDGFDYWRLCDELTVVQAALLIAGCDPSVDSGYVEERPADQRPLGYEAAKTAISNALRRGSITGRVTPLYEYDPDFGRRRLDGSVEVTIERGAIVRLSNP